MVVCVEKQPPSSTRKIRCLARAMAIASLCLPLSCGKGKAGGHNDRSAQWMAPPSTLFAPAEPSKQERASRLLPLVEDIPDLRIGRRFSDRPGWSAMHQLSSFTQTGSTHTLVHFIKDPPLVVGVVFDGKSIKAEVLRTSARHPREFRSAPSADGRRSLPDMTPALSCPSNPMDDDILALALEGTSNFNPRDIDFTPLLFQDDRTGEMTIIYLFSDKGFTLSPGRRLGYTISMIPLEDGGLEGSCLIVPVSEQGPANLGEEYLRSFNRAMKDRLER